MAGHLSSDGQRYAQRAKHSSIGGILSCEVPNYRTELLQKGIIPKNHHKDNKRAIKELQEKVALKHKQEQMAFERKNSKFVLHKFANVDSKVKQNLEKESMQQTIKTKENENIAGNTTTTPQNISKKTTTKVVNKPIVRKKSLENRKPPVPSRNEVVNLKRRESPTNYVSQNRKSAIQSHVKSNETAEKLWTKKEDYGKIPAYLVERRLELAEKERQRLEAAEKAKIPKGMRKMEENERLETLALLGENKSSVELAIRKLPFTIETPSMIRHEKQLRTKLEEIEKAIQIFSKKIVFVAESNPQ